jgi:hypothetical protein
MIMLHTHTDCWQIVGRQMSWLLLQKQSGELAGRKDNSKFILATDDYHHRPACLEHLSPVLFTMLYEKRVQMKSSSSAAAAPDTDAAAAQQDAAAVGHGASTNSSRLQHGKRKLTSDSTVFLPSHPQYLTHHLVRRMRPQLLRFFQDPPPRPAGDAPSEEHKGWAAYVVANFTTHRVLSGSSPQPPFQAAALAWEQSTGAASAAPTVSSTNGPQDCDIDVDMHEANQDDPTHTASAAVPAAAAIAATQTSVISNTIDRAA